MTNSAKEKNRARLLQVHEVKKGLMAKDPALSNQAALKAAWKVILGKSQVAEVVVVKSRRRRRGLSET